MKISRRSLHYRMLLDFYDGSEWRIPTTACGYVALCVGVVLLWLLLVWWLLPIFLACTWVSEKLCTPIEVVDLENQ